MTTFQRLRGIQTHNALRRCWSAGRKLASYTAGRLLLRYLIVRHWQVVQELRPLASHLEHEVFPEMKHRAQPYLFIRKGGQGDLIGTASDDSYRFPGCVRLSASLEQLGIDLLELDVELESGQIVEAFLLACYVGNYLDKVEPAGHRYEGWRPRPVAQQLVSKQGYQKFCARMQYTPGLRTYRIEYFYCELALSRMLRSYVEGHSRYGDHRALFAAAPKWGLTALLILLVPPILYPIHPAAAMWSSVAIALVAGLGAGISVHLAASLQFTREHHDKLLQEHMAQIRRLSRFPQTNPNLVMEITPAGRPSFVNKAGKQLLAELGLSEDQPAGYLPHGYDAMIRQAFQQPETPVSTEATVGDKSFQFRFAAFQDQPTAIVVGTDVTYLKTIEAELRELYERVAKQKEEISKAYDALDRELAVVGEMQRSLLPKADPNIPGLDIAAYYETSRRAGGDYYDFFHLPGDRWGILIADVSGHGTPAAVLMAITHSIVHLYHDWAPDITSEAVLAVANSILYERYGSSGDFVTAFYGIYDPEYGTLTYAMAGHNPPRIIRESLGTLEYLDSARGLPLGVTGDAVFDSVAVDLVPGDTLVLYTDGITEAMGPGRQLYGEDRLDELLSAGPGPAPHLLDELLNDLRTFTQNNPPNDDRTLVVLQKDGDLPVRNDVEVHEQFPEDARCAL